MYTVSSVSSRGLGVLIPCKIKHKRRTSCSSCGKDFMKLQALSHYNHDTDTRYGDCILLHDATTLVVYDCGHKMHAKTVEQFLLKNSSITTIYLVVSHNDSDHTDGMIELMEYLYENEYDVTLYSSLYLKSARTVLKQFDDSRRTLSATKEHILETFDNINEIVEKAEALGFSVKNAEVNASFAGCVIVGPTEDEFSEVVAKAIEDGEVSHIEGETVMNAASVQLKCTLDGQQTVILCGDASPFYLHNLDIYQVIQLPHHGKLDNAEEIFNNLKSPYSKQFLVSDNTGSGETSGGSDALIEYMKKEKMIPAHNTRYGVVQLPKSSFGSGESTTQGVKLGEMDCKRWR